MIKEKEPKPKTFTLRHIFNGAGANKGPMLIMRVSISSDSPVGLTLGWLGDGTAKRVELARLSRHLKKKGLPLSLFGTFIDQHL